MPALLVFFVAMCVGLLGGLALKSGSDESAASDPLVQTRPAGVPGTSERSARAVAAETPELRLSVEAAAKRGLEAVQKSGDRAAVAVWPTGWSKPVVVEGNAPARSKMWSLSKPVAAIAASEAATRDSPNGASASLKLAMSDALRRSDNCAQRRVVMGLQKLSGDKQAAAVQSFAEVLRRANVLVETGPDSTPLTSAEQKICADYLTKVAPLPEASTSDVAQFGSVEWGLIDAVSFANALASGAYGESGRGVIRLMTLPKLPPRPDGDSTAPTPKDLSWGAGKAFSGWRPAYKAGWGGRLDGNYSVAQLGVIRGVSPNVAFASIVFPKQPASSEDPEATTGPKATEQILSSIRTQLEGWVAQK